MTTRRLVTIGLPLLGLLVLGKAFFGSEQVIPSLLLNEVRERISTGHYDERQALLDLDRAIIAAEQRGDEVLVANVLSVKAEVLRTLGSLIEAQVVLERLLEEHVPENPRVELRLAEVVAARDQPERSLDLVAKLIEREPTFAPAWRLAGRLQTERAAGFLEEAVEIARGVLPVAQAEEAVVHIEALAFRSPNDPERSANAAVLNSLLADRDPVSLEAIFDKVFPAAEDNALARACLARGCGGDVDGETVAMLMDHCTAAGQGDLAIELGTAARYIPRLERDTDIIAALLTALVEANREGQLRDVLASWRWREDFASLKFHEAACRALYQLKDGRNLMQAQSALAELGGTAGNQMSTFYRAMCQVWAKNWENAELLLERYLDFDEEDRVEPVPGAVARAWEELASARRELGEVRTEREALVGVTQVSRESDVPGEVWLRLVELSLRLPNISYEVAEERFTKAMAAMPERTTELEQQWYELGELALEERGHDLPGMLMRLSSQRLALPPYTIGPASKVRLAQSHLENGETRFAMRVAREVVDAYPTLLPAIDVLIEALLQRENEAEAASLLLDRISLAGRDPRSLDFLRRMGEDSLNPEQKLEAMLADPGVTGRMILARTALERDEPQRALDALMASSKEDGRESAELQLLIGEAFLHDGRHQPAVDRLQELRDEPELGGTAMQLEIEARVLGGIGEGEEMLGLVQKLASREELDPVTALAAADRLLASGWPLAAAPLLELLDASPETRSGELFLRQAVLASHGPDPDDALEPLERADPYLADGRARVGHLLLAVDARSWAALPELVAELRAGGFEPDVFEEAILSVFEERPEAAWQLADAELARPDTSIRDAAHWAIVGSAARLLGGMELELPEYFGSSAARQTTYLLQGAGEVPRDPREVLGPLMALRRDTWHSWGAQRLQNIDTKVAPLWSLYLGADARSDLGDSDGARRALDMLQRRFADFGPGWDALELAMREEGYGEAGITRIRVQRLEALGPELAGTPLEIAVDTAAGLALDGKPLQARKALHEAIRKAELEAAESRQPAPTLGRDLLARLELQLGNNEAALDAYMRASDALPAYSDAPLIEEICDWLEVARRSEALSPQVVQQTLTRLENRFPDDPLIPLTASRIDVEHEPTPAGLARSVRRLVGFLDRAAPRPVEELRAGSAREYVEFLLPIAPAEAATLVEADLGRNPGDLDLWLLDAEILVARGRSREALDRLELLTEMSGSPSSHLSLAHALARRGGVLPRDIDRHLSKAEKGLDDAGPQIMFVRQLMVLDNEKRVPPKNIENLRNLWRRRGELRGDLPISELGRTYAAALLTRRTPVDLRRLEEVIDDLIDGNPEGYLRDTLRAMLGLAPQMGRATDRGTVPQELSQASEEEETPALERQGDQKLQREQRRLEENRAKAAQLRANRSEDSAGEDSEKGKVRKDRAQGSAAGQKKAPGKKPEADSR